MQVRQAQARDMGSHTEYLIDATAKDGIMKLNTVVRLRSLLGHHLPAVTRIVFNNKSLCGAPLTEAELSESVIVSAKPQSTSSTSTVSSLKLGIEDYYY
ncbi:unnamed protein product [Allacma fusca]|uniref:Uncharacterized protein n=1 Tax=Allacma fusca TaxID=39272 RepID=A0A8J2K1W6_9HEXA|nr:unnamed protein product [Allacma fusca]